MMRLTFILLTVVICWTLFGQTKNDFEISLIGRYDKHANYVSNFAGRVYKDTNKFYSL
jgi:ABC-type uncharacterized transport system permease subunit